MPARLALALLLLAAAPAAAEGVLSGEAFERLSAGRTLHFSHLGQPYGSEQFFSGRRSLWRHADGSCAEGRWREVDGMICFSYDADPGWQCWELAERAGRVSAELVEGGAGTGLVLDLERIAEDRLDCPGPEVGS
jgi:hypothetical protein